jgi:hypothetical protein
MPFDKKRSKRYLVYTPMKRPFLCIIASFLMFTPLFAFNQDNYSPVTLKQLIKSCDREPVSRTQGTKCGYLAMSDGHGCKIKSTFTGEFRDILPRHSELLRLWLQEVRGRGNISSYVEELQLMDGSVACWMPLEASLAESLKKCPKGTTITFYTQYTVMDNFSQHPDHVIIVDAYKENSKDTIITPEDE